MKKAGLLIAASCFLFSGAFAQGQPAGQFAENRSAIAAQPPIKGVLTDKETGEPICGATVVNKATKEGTITNEQGEFTIAGSDKKTILSISFLGYKPQELLVKDAAQTLNLTLDQTVSAIQEVVVIGYGKSTRDKLTGSVTTVTGEDLETAAISNLLEALQGRVAGMYLAMSSGLPGDETAIEIRGKNSMNMKSGSCCQSRPLTKTDPLILIDGVPFASESISALGLGSIGEIDPLSSLNPADVERIEVLKDADATAIYGSRGSNGVILITTKKGI